MRICKVWDSEYPWDVRVEKVALALATAGHEVHIVARNRLRRPLVERLPEATVHRLAHLRGMPSALSGASMFPAFFNPRWYNAIRRVAKETNADLILCRDLPLAIPSILAARSLGVPCVMDMAEVYPAMLQSRWDTGRLGFSDYFVRNPRAAAAVERWSLRRLDGVAVVVKESADRLVRLGVPEHRVALVSNTPSRERLKGPQADHSGPVVDVVYLGLMELQRGIGLLLEAISELVKAGLPFRLTLVGGGHDLGILRSMSASLGLHDPEVRFLGQMPNAEALREIARAQIGVVPHWADESWNHTIPNKLFDYMAAGMAVVTSDARPAARIVTAARCGGVFRSGDASHLAEQLRTLQSAGARREAGRNGRAAIEAEHNWEADTDRLLHLLDDVVARHSALRGTHTSV